MLALHPQIGVQLANGGFGVVNRAVVQLPGSSVARAVAVKQTLASLSKRALHDLLGELKKAYLVAKECEHICAMLGLTVVGGKPALVMPLFEHNAEFLLDEEFPDGMPPELVLTIALPVARALASLHGRGLVHCDLKVGNATRPTVGAEELLLPHFYAYNVPRLHIL